MELCPHLRRILEIELENGNEIDSQGQLWTKMEFSVYLKKPMNKDEIIDTLTLDKSVKYSKSEDPHYMMHGFYCELCKHTIDSPLQGIPGF